MRLRIPLSFGKSRFEAFSDGVFAIAITLLVLEIHVPDLRTVTNGSVAHALAALWPQYLVYVASFATIGICWLNHQSMFRVVEAIRFDALLYNLLLLMVISFVPFPTLLLGRYGLLPATAALYALVFLALSLCFNLLLYHALLPAHEHPSARALVKTRNAWNTIGLLAYCVAAAVAWISPLASILICMAVAVYYAMPRGITDALAALGEHRRADEAL